MTRIFDFILGLLTAAALSSSAQFEWQQFATGGNGDTWHVRKGTVAIASNDGKSVLQGVVLRRESSGAEFIYRGATNADHCGRQRGGVAIETLDGQPVASLLYVRGTDTVGASLAAFLCQHRASRGTP